MSNMKPLRVPQILIKPFQFEDLRSLLYLCDDKTFLGVRNKAIILAFLDTAVRLKELINIQIVDINFDRGIIKVMGKRANLQNVRSSPQTLYS